MNLDDEVDEVRSHEPFELWLGVHEVDAGSCFALYERDQQMNTSTLSCSLILTSIWCMCWTTCVWYSSSSNRLAFFGESSTRQSTLMRIDSCDPDDNGCFACGIDEEEELLDLRVVADVLLLLAPLLLLLLFFLLR